MISTQNARIAVRTHVSGRICMIGLVLFAAAGAVACNIDEPNAPAPIAAVHAAVPFNPDSIQLSNLCGNRFAIQNANDFAAEVKWDVVGTADSGRVTLPARVPGQSYTEVYITTQLPGVTRLFYQGQLVETAVNAGIPCAAGHLVPAIAPPAVSRTYLDSLGLYPPHRGIRFRRDIIILTFKVGTGRALRQQAIDLIRGVVIGGRRWRPGDDGSYYVQVPHEAALDDLARLALRLHNLPQVANAFLANVDLMLDGSYLRPDDGNSWRTNNWRVDRRAAEGTNWALEYVDGPLAWGCSTGDTAVRLAVLDYGFPQTPDVDAHTVRRIEPGLFQDHGTRVASVLGARGNNGTGITGMMWRAALDLVNWNTIPPSTDSLSVTPDEQNNAHTGNIIRVAQDGASIINISQASPWGSLTLGTLVPPATAADSILIAGRRKSISDALAILALEGRFPLLVISAGNSSLDASVAGYAGARADYADQIIVVGALAKDSVPRRWPDSNHGPLVDIYAPGENVGAIRYLTGADTLSSGTSFAAPLVAGTAGLLESFDSRSEMTATLMKQLILAGTVDSVTEPNGAKKPVLSAYGALKKAALRSGSGACANRVWLASDSIYVGRASSNEAIASAPAPATVIAAGHGSTLGAGSTYIAFRNGAWVSTTYTADPYDPGGPERTFSGFSHDRDSLTFWEPNLPTSIDYTTLFKVYHSDTVRTPGRTRQLNTVPVSQLGGPSDCAAELASNHQCIETFDSSPIRPSTNTTQEIEMPALTYSPLGDETVIAVPHLSHIFGPGSNLTFTPCPTYGTGYNCKTFDVRRQVDSTVIWSIKHQGGAKTRLFAVAGKRVRDIALASDGAEIVVIAAPSHTGELFRGSAAVANTVYEASGPCTTQFFRRDGTQNFSVSSGLCWYTGMMAPKRRPPWQLIAKKARAGR